MSRIKAFVVFSFLQISQTALAQSTIGGGLVNPLTCPPANDLVSCVTKITGFILTIAIPIVSIMVLVGGFQMMTAGGDPEKFSKGRKTILYAAIGFVVVLLADSVATLIKNFLGA